MYIYFYMYTHIFVLIIKVVLFILLNISFALYMFLNLFSNVFYLSQCHLKFKCQCICPGLLAEPASWEMEHEFISKSYLPELTLQPAWIKRKDLAGLTPPVKKQRLTSTVRESKIRKAQNVVINPVTSNQKQWKEKKIEISLWDYCSEFGSCLLA